MLIDYSFCLFSLIETLIYELNGSSDKLSDETLKSNLSYLSYRIKVWADPTSSYEKKLKELLISIDSEFKNRLLDFEIPTYIPKI